MGTITVRATYDADGALRIVVPGAKGKPGEAVDVDVSVDAGGGKRSCGESAVATLDDPTFMVAERPAPSECRSRAIADAMDGAGERIEMRNDEERIAECARELGVPHAAFRDPAAIAREAARLGVAPARISYIVPGGATVLLPAT